MPEPFGSFGWICRHTVLPQCNLLFSQLYNYNPQLTTLFPASSDVFSSYNVTSGSVTDDTNVQAARSIAGTGVGAGCEVRRVGEGSSGDIALIVLSALSILFAGGLAVHATRRHAAVGRVELRLLLVLYAVLCALQIVDMSSLLEQGSKAIAIVSSIHIALFVSFFWILLGNALIATQVVEWDKRLNRVGCLLTSRDGTLAALVPLTLFAILFFAPVLYIALAVAFNWTDSFTISATDAADLPSTALFVLTLVWPAAAAGAYVVIMMYVILARLGEVKPAVYTMLATAAFVGAQVIFFLASEPLCKASSGKVNGAFLGTLLNTAAMGFLYLAWMSITEEEWGEDPYAYEAW